MAFFFGGERHVIISEAVLKVGLNIPGDADHQPVIFHPGCRKHIASVHDTHKRFRVMQVIDPLCVPFPVRPGDVLRIECELTNLKKNIGIAEGRAYVGEKLAVKCDFTFAIIEH